MAYSLIFLKGFITGFLISTPVSPVGILCFRRSIHYGPRIGFFSGLGSATADFFLSIIAAFGLSFIMRIIDVHEWYLRLAGSIFLVLIGTYILYTPPKVSVHAPVSKNILRAYFSIFALTLSNPATIPSLAALFAGIGVGTLRHTTEFVILASSVSLGATAWWASLAGIVSIIQTRLQGEFL